jgi:hypothetical protein
MPKYNHMYSIAFSIDTDTEDPYEVDVAHLRAALIRRASQQRDTGSFHHEDTYEHDEGTPYCKTFMCLVAALPGSKHCLDHKPKT